MIAVFATSALCFAFFLLLTLPLVPACRELIYKTDDAPLKVIQQHAGDVRFFADGFRSYLTAIQASLDQNEHLGTDTSVVMPDGMACLILARQDAQHDFGIDAKSICSKVIASVKALTLPHSTTFEKDIYARRALHGGSGDQFRAILGERDVHLGEASTVMRWVHGVGDVSCERDCRLYGRISSESSIRLHAGCRFTRLNAPRIEIGPRETDETSAEDAAFGRPELVITERLLHEGDLSIAPGAVFDRHLVVRGELRVGAGAQLLGNVKAQKNVVLETGVRAYGSMISAAVLRIGPECHVRGPLIAEGLIAIGPGTTVGTIDSPTTVSAPRIEIVEGARVFGTLWAREQGQAVRPA
jgi:cytoskeletal protein CcmA (bactofilin family)